MTRPRRRPTPELPPPGPHALPAWLTSPGHLVAWCPWCLQMHTHGHPPGAEEGGHRVAHCWVGPGLGDYDLVLLGRWSPTWQAWVRDTWGDQLAQRARLLRARGAYRAYRVWWPAPYSEGER